MKGILVSADRFKEICDEKGMSRYALARLIGSTDYQMWRLSNGKPTSFRFLERLVPVFSLSDIADIIADQDKSDAFTFWYVATHKPDRKAA
ncbi:helix-turn-helix transcriptional regulator [Microbispora sp. ZYX-F-249]|uniref:Helix-turn-helix transcriptional regulator n=1 Tax=Microbispora maris TaxID=3144104 RepID=A0ABV0AUB3_9ACTN